MQVTQQHKFPFLVYGSNCLKEALDRYKLNPITRSNIRALIRTEHLKKAFTYLFWIYFALKFQDKSFGNLNHFMSLDHVFGDQKISGKEKYLFKQEDLAIGRERRINFIKYWRMKF